MPGGAHPWPTGRGAGIRGAGGALGQAEANRLLGEVNLRRGQLSQAIAVFDRAIRAMRTLKAQLPYARATLGAAEAYRRKGTPRKAEDLFTEARDLARETGHAVLEARAALGLGQIARHRGLSATALPLLQESERQLVSQYLAHHASVLALLRAQGTPLVGLLAGTGHSAAFFSNALQADRLYALASARVVAMEPAAVARVTGIAAASLIEDDAMLGQPVRHLAAHGGVAAILEDATLAAMGVE